MISREICPMYNSQSVPWTGWSALKGKLWQKADKRAGGRERRVRASQAAAEEAEDEARGVVVDRERRSGCALLQCPRDAARERLSGNVILKRQPPAHLCILHASKHSSALRMLRSDWAAAKAKVKADAKHGSQANGKGQARTGRNG